MSPRAPARAWAILRVHEIARTVTGNSKILFHRLNATALSCLSHANARRIRCDRDGKKYHKHQILHPLTAYRGCVTCDHNKRGPLEEKNGAFENFYGRSGLRADGPGRCSASSG